MTEPMKPDDRELEQYIEGKSPLSRRYREASREVTPPELDDAVLAQARAAVRRKPVRRGGWVSGLAVAASIVVAVNLGQNVWRAEPVPDESAALRESLDRAEPRILQHRIDPLPQPAAPAPAAPKPPEKQRLGGAGTATLADALEKERSEAKAKRDLSSQEERLRQMQAAESSRKEEGQALARAEAERHDRAAGAAVPSAAPSAAMAAEQAAPLTEAQKIDRLINHVGGLAGATFIRNGKEYGATEAAKHLQLKREKAGDRVQTADDFIRLCASYSTTSGDAYLIRFADGRTRTAEDVLREELARLNLAP